MHRIFTWGLAVGKHKEVIEPADEQEAPVPRPDLQMCPCGCGYRAMWFSYPDHSDYNYQWQSPEGRIKMREAEYDAAVQALADARIAMATARATLDKARG